MKSWKQAIAETECNLFHEALTATGGDVQAAAELLEMQRTTLHRKIDIYKVDMEFYRKGKARLRRKASRAKAKATKSARPKAKKKAKKGKLVLKTKLKTRKR